MQLSAVALLIAMSLAMSDALGAGGKLRAGVPRAVADRRGKIDHAESSNLHHSARASYERAWSALNAALNSELSGQATAIDSSSRDLPVIVAGLAPVASHKAGLYGISLQARCQQRGTGVKGLRQGHLLAERIGDRHRDCACPRNYR